MTRSLDRVMIIGSNSFSGASFAAYLLRHGTEVVGLSRSPEPHEAFLPYRWNCNQTGFRFVEVDINHDLSKLKAILGEVRPSTVVNFAAQSMVAESWANPEHWYETNVVSTVKLHDEIRRCDFVNAYVHVTTPEVYGSTSGNIDETAPFNPSTPYAVSRAAADMSLRTYRSRYGFPVLFTRAANIFGEGQQLYRIVPRAVLSVRTGRKLQLHGGGTSERSFIHADDVAAATRLIAQHGQLGDTYHISTDLIVTIRRLVELICERLGVPFDAHVSVAEERPGKDAAYRLDSGKLRSELGWTDKVSLESGLDRVIEWTNKYLPVFSSSNWDYQHKP